MAETPDDLPTVADLVGSDPGFTDLPADEYVRQLRGEAVESQGDTFSCSQCGGTFEKEWSDEDALTEALEVFGSPIDEPVVVCDDCYEAIQSWGRRTGVFDMERERLALIAARLQSGRQ